MREALVGAPDHGEVAVHRAKACIDRRHVLALGFEQGAKIVHPGWFVLLWGDGLNPLAWRISHGSTVTDLACSGKFAVIISVDNIVSTVLAGVCVE